MESNQKLDQDILRTVLANERTMLAYVRTALSLVVFGMAVIKFFYDDSMLVAIGWFSVIGGFLILLWGVRVFSVRNRNIQQIKASERG